MAAGPSALRRMIYGLILGLALCAATLTGLEILSAFYAPPWPARELRSALPINPVSAAHEPFASRPWLAEPFNSWGMRDKERRVDRGSSKDTRAIFVGDSFVEASFSRQSLPIAVEKRLNGVEAINLGISATDPPSYYFRLRDVGLNLSPDLVLLFVYMGNDFVTAEEAFGASSLSPLVGDSEGDSLLGAVMPRTRWLLRNRWPALKAFWQVHPPSDEEPRLYRIAREPRPTAIKQLGEFMQQYYAPQLPLERIEEVLSRGDDRLWRNLEEQEADPEFLMGWTLNNVLVWETGTFPTARNLSEARAFTPNSIIEATASWIVAMEHLATMHGIRVKTFIVPVGRVDPDYNVFWTPWPRSYSWNYICDDREERLVSFLTESGIGAVQLRNVLQGVRDTYRKRDGHWTETGEAIVADRVAVEMKRMGY